MAIFKIINSRHKQQLLSLDLIFVALSNYSTNKVWFELLLIVTLLIKNLLTVLRGNIASPA